MIFWKKNIEIQREISGNGYKQYKSRGQLALGKVSPPPSFQVTEPIKNGNLHQSQNGPPEEAGQIESKLETLGRARSSAMTNFVIRHQWLYCESVR